MSTQAFLPLLLVHITTDVNYFHGFASEELTKLPGVSKVSLLPRVVQFIRAVFFEPRKVFFDKSIASFLVGGNFERNGPTLENLPKQVTRIERNKKRRELTFVAKKLIEFFAKFKPMGGFGEGRVVQLEGAWSEMVVDVLPNGSGG